MDVNEMISKSLDEIEAMTEELSKSKATEDTEDTISKAQGDEDLSAGDVSEDAPEQDEQGEEPEQDDADTSNEDVDSDDEGEEDSDEDEEVEKSLEKDLKSNDSVRKALEVSEFLDNLVKSISDHISIHNDSLAKSIESANQSNEIVAKSLMGIVKSQQAVLQGQAELQKELQKSIRSLNKRLKAIEEQPLVRKSVPSAKALNKSFDASLGGTPKANEGKSLSKSEVLSKLATEAQNNPALVTDVLAYESTGDLGTLSNEARTILGL